MVHSSPVLKSWGFLYIFAVHIGELRFNPHLVLFGGFLCHLSLLFAVHHIYRKYLHSLIKI